MDLIEKKENSTTHPWEIARVKVIADLFRTHIPLEKNKKVLEIGCGDGYIIKTLAKKFPKLSWSAIDINFDNHFIKELQEGNPSIRFYKKYKDIKNEKYDLLLFFDVLEHIEDSVFFLRDAVEKLLKIDGMVLITVPAFQSLFTDHDVFLKHYRRYSLSQLKSLLIQAKVQKNCKYGYFFFSLLLIRTLNVIVNFLGSKLLGYKSKAKGVGQWKGNRWVTYVLEKLLLLDAFILKIFNYFNIKIPGLSIWILCLK